jgi:hypothetical protein
MASETFYEIYRKLAAGRTDHAKALPALEELALACRATSSDEWGGEAADCLHEIAQSSSLFAAAVTKWVTCSEDVQLAKALVHGGNVRHLQQPAAETYKFSSLSVEKVILAACRLCSLNATPAISLGWTLSLFTSFPGNAEAKRAGDYLLQHLVNEFPQTTRRLLSSDESPFKQTAEATTALEFLDAEEVRLNSFSRLREFVMTPDMRLAIAGLRRRENRDINRHAREKSIFMKIFKAEHFKYSTKTAVEFGAGGTVQETALEMSPYSLTVELPISEQTDPMTGTLIRRRLWRGVPQ